MLRTMKAPEKSGFVSILFSQAEEPLMYWDKQVRSGRIKRIFDESDKGKLQALEILGNNVHSTFVSTPTSDYPSLGVTLPVLVLIVKNLKRYFFYQVQILDDKNVRRRFRMTNIPSPAFNRRQPTLSTFSIKMEDGWNELAINLAELTEKVYGTHYVETVRVEIHANCRLREVFFCEKMDVMKVQISQSTLNNHIGQLTYTDLIRGNNSLKELEQGGGRGGEKASSDLLIDPDNNNMSTKNFSDCNSDFIKNSKNKMTSPVVENARQRIRDYEELAKKVKSYTVASDTFSKSIVGKLEDSKELKAVTKNLSSFSSSSPPSSSNYDDSTSSSLSFGERLKRNMYFERPKQQQQQQQAKQPNKIEKNNHRSNKKP